LCCTQCSPDRDAYAGNYAIKPDTHPGLEKWLSINTEYAKLRPNIALKKEPPADAKEQCLHLRNRRMLRRG
jgi:ferredoxin